MFNKITSSYSPINDFCSHTREIIDTETGHNLRFV